MKAIGLMSGTSLDGLDIAYCFLDGYYTSTKVQLLKFDEVKMPASLKEKIMKACSAEESSTPLVCSLNFELGSWMGDCVHRFLEKYHISQDEVDFIASHGQTIWHQPESKDGYVHSTLQIGEPAEIAWRTGIQVISNFRTMDMAAGGSGAPLVPYADYILYRSPLKSRILLNVGGIANVTSLPANCKEDEVSAFDTGPGNMMIDEAMRRLYGKEYDEDGNTARSGQINEAMLDELMAAPYITTRPPKSTGREMFGQARTAALLEKYRNVSKEDIICTLTAFTAESIALNIHAFSGSCEELIAAGGGAHNHTLLAMLAKKLPESKVLTQEDLGFSSDAKEAVAFAILGNETLHNHYANMVSATGASTKVILGNITPKPVRFSDE